MNTVIFPEGMTPEALRRAVADLYGQVAAKPESPHPFPTGRDYALSLGYTSEVLDSLPQHAVDAFAGISHPLQHANLQTGEIVLDLGCGAGMDSILAAREIGPTGTVHSLDASQEMLHAARLNAATANTENVIIHFSPAEEIPLDTNSLDVVIVNGIFNLCACKQTVMAEVYRVLRPGGRMLAAEIVRPDADLSPTQNSATLADWFK